MNTRTRSKFLFMFLSFACQCASAATVTAGSGVGFTSRTSASAPWVASIIFGKSDLKGTETVIKTDDSLTPSQQAAFGVNMVVPPTTSNGWCDPASNPDIANNTDYGTCYGAALESKWIVLDLNALQKGNSAVWVTITAKSYDDGQPTETDGNGNTLTTDDDLIPALTVYRGRQDLGDHLSWYPNKFQKNPFWAWKLSPFTASGNDGYATALSTDSRDSATVVGKVNLKAGGNNFLTVVVGGDAQHQVLTDKHDVNFQVSVKLSKKKPATSTDNGNGGNGGGSGLVFDSCGCELGKTQWHLAMNHCMNIPACNDPEWKDGAPGVRCQTPAECDANKGRWQCGDPGVSCK